MRLILLPIICCLGTQADAFQSQYHIQADTGDIKFFKYSTYGGQYRKETRLDNGTVIGTFGWRDGDGLVRYYDYVADSNGFRIVLNKQETTRTSKQSVASVFNNTLHSSSSLKQKVIKRRRARKHPLDPRSRKLTSSDVGERSRSSGRLDLRPRRVEKQKKIPTEGQEVLPYQEPLLLTNQYPSGSQRPYLRLLGEEEIIKVPKPGSTQMENLRDDSPRRPSSDSKLDNINSTSNKSGLPSHVLLKKIKVTISEKDVNLKSSEIVNSNELVQGQARSSTKSLIKGRRRNSFSPPVTSPGKGRRRLRVRARKRKENAAATERSEQEENLLSTNLFISTTTEKSELNKFVYFPASK